MMLLPLPDFEPTFDALEGYRALVADQLSHVQQLLLREASQRLKDLQVLGTRIHSRAEQLLQDPPPIGGVTAAHALEILREAAPTHPELAEWFAKNADPKLAGTSKSLSLGHDEGQPSLESAEEQDLRLDAELFYYVAHRFCVCLALLPGLKNFECKDIAIIRNQLLEHPEKPSSGVLFPTFGYRSNVGPVVKGMRYSHQVDIHADAGFIPNCRVLLDLTSTALLKAVERLSPSEHGTQ